MEEIIIDGLDEIEMQNTAVDDIDSENVNLIFIGIDKSGSMSSYRGDIRYWFQITLTRKQIHMHSVY